MSQVFDAETLSRAARVVGVAWTPQELEAARPAVEAALALLATLDALPLDAIEPTTQYRIL